MSTLGATGRGATSVDSGHLPICVTLPDMARTGWTAADIPDLTGRTAVVTGANSGLGLVTAVELARHGAQVTLACRDPQRGAEALREVQAVAAGAAPELASLDLSAQASVRAFAEAWTFAHPDGLDLLINNAGVMAIPRRVTVDGWETQFATNHLGHFALTGRLLPALQARPGARVVTVASNAHKFGKVRFDDLMGERRYSAWGAYGQSKVANLLFTDELQRRLDAAGIPVQALAAHPGYAATSLTANGPGAGDSAWARAKRAVIQGADGVLGQSAEMGALPQLYAATVPNLPGAAYVGPDRWLEQRGHPAITRAMAKARDPEAARRLWEISEDLTGVRYPG